MLGPLKKNGGRTQTMALLSASPAIDAGNPSGCTDASGHLLKIHQRGEPHPDKMAAAIWELSNFRRTELNILC